MNIKKWYSNKRVAKTKKEKDEAGFTIQVAGDWIGQQVYKPTMKKFARNHLYGWIFAKDFRDTFDWNNMQKFADKVKDITTPTLIIEGRWDMTWAIDKGKLFVKQFTNNPKLIIMQNSSHSPFADEARYFFKHLKKFIQSNYKHGIDKGGYYNKYIKYKNKYIRKKQEYS